MKEDDLLQMFKSLASLVDLSVNHSVSETRRNNAHVLAYLYKQVCLSYINNPEGEWFQKDKERFQASYANKEISLTLHCPWQCFFKEFEFEL